MRARHKHLQQLGTDEPCRPPARPRGPILAALTQAELRARLAAVPLPSACVGGEMDWSRGAAPCQQAWLCPGMAARGGEEIFLLFVSFHLGSGWG